MPCHPDGARQAQHELAANRGIGVGLRPAEDLEGERQKRVARENGGCLVEGLVHGRAAAAQIVIVHGRKVVVHERVAMDAFDGCGGGESLGLRNPE